MIDKKFYLILIVIVLVFGFVFYSRLSRKAKDSTIDVQESLLFSGDRRPQSASVKVSQSKSASNPLKETGTEGNKNSVNKDFLPANNAANSLKDDKQAPFLVRNSRPITPKEDFIYPRWSPDGLDILFTRAKYRGLYLVSVNGSGIRELSDELGIGYKVRWSEDGTKLIIEKDGKTITIDLTGEEVETDSLEEQVNEPIFAKDDNIYFKNPDTGELEQLTDGEDAYFNPQLSPDGSKVAYEGLTTGINIKDLETGEVINIGRGSNIQWTPDGRGLIYDYTQDDGEQLIAGDIYFAFADGSGVFNLTNTPDIIEHNVRISPDGTKIIYEVDGQIYVADLLNLGY